MAISPSTRPAQDRRARPARWIALLVASLLLHLLAFNWADGRFGMPSLHEPEQTPPVVTTRLLLPPAPPVAAPRKPKARPHRPPPHPSPPPPPSEPIVESIVTLPPADLEAFGTSVEPASEIAVEDSTAPAAASAADAQDTARYKVDPPPSAELEYDVQALRDGQKWFGSGMFRWQSSGNTYSVTGEASVRFLFKITVLNFRSEGEINEFGVAPVLYSEKPWRKAMTNTHFQHAGSKISFSASEATYPYRGGEQDRASVMWQLAGIGRGDASQFAPGTEIDLVVAGTRDADTWRIQIVGQEEVQTAAGALTAWHVVRAPRPGSYDQKIDIWLAPAQEWYPVKVLYTYANGDHLDMSLSRLTPGAAP